MNTFQGEPSPTYKIWDTVPKETMDGRTRFLLYRLIYLSFNSRLVNAKDLYDSTTLSKNKIIPILQELMELKLIEKYVVDGHLKKKNHDIYYEVIPFTTHVPCE